MLDSDTVREGVEAVLRDRFGNIKIEAIHVCPDLDAEGDPIFFIDIVFDAEHGRPSLRETSSVTRHILEKLGRNRGEGFPVVSFISKHELKRGKTKAA